MLLILLFLLLPLVHPTSQGGSSSDAAGGSNQGGSANPFLQDPETIRAMAVQKAIQRATQQGNRPPGIPDRAEPNDLFDKVADDVKCDTSPDGKLTNRPAKDMKECKQRCIDHRKCVYFAFWTQRKYCETYTSCHYRSPDNGQPIVLYKKLTVCEEELSRGKMKYIERMKAAFPDNVVRPWGTDNPNFVCKCTTDTWMLCALIVRPGSMEDQVAQKKLNRNNPQNLKPFYLFDFGDGTRPPICFDDLHGNGFPSVIAEIQIIPTEQCVPMEICEQGTGGGICPVRKVPFESREPAYIINRDFEKMMKREPLQCVTVSGLRSIYSQAEELLKEGRDEEYLMLWLFNEADRATGICEQAKAKKSSGTRGGKKKKKKDKGSDAGDGSESIGPSSSDQLSLQSGSPNPAVMGSFQPGRQVHSEGDLKALEAAAAPVQAEGIQPDHSASSPEDPGAGELSPIHQSPRGPQSSDTAAPPMSQPAPGSPHSGPPSVPQSPSRSAPASPTRSRASSPEDFGPGLESNPFALLDKPRGRPSPSAPLPESIPPPPNSPVPEDAEPQDPSPLAYSSAERSPPPASPESPTPPQASRQASATLPGASPEAADVVLEENQVVAPPAAPALQDASTSLESKVKTMTMEQRQRRKAARAKKGIPRDFLTDSPPPELQEGATSSKASRTVQRSWMLESWSGGRPGSSSAGSPPSDFSSAGSPPVRNMGSPAPVEDKRLKPPARKEDKVQTSNSTTLSLHFFFLTSLLISLYVWLLNQKQSTPQDFYVEFLEGEL